MSVIALKCPNINDAVVDFNETQIAAWNNDNLDNLPVYEGGHTDLVAGASIAKKIDSSFAN